MEVKAADANAIAAVLESLKSAHWTIVEYEAAEAMVLARSHLAHLRQRILDDLAVKKAKEEVKMHNGPVPPPMPVVKREEKPKGKK